MKSTRVYRLRSCTHGAASTWMCTLSGLVALQEHARTAKWSTLRVIYAIAADWPDSRANQRAQIQSATGVAAFRIHVTTHAAVDRCSAALATACRCFAM